MKTVIALFWFFTISSASETYDLKLIGNRYDDLVTEALEYIRSLLQKYNPYKLPSISDHHLVNTDIDLLFSADNVQLANAGDFRIDKISNNIILLKSSFGFTVRTAHIHGNCKIIGTAYNKAVRGSGTFMLNVNELVEASEIQFGIEDHSLQVKDLNLNISIMGLETSVEGIVIEGMTAAEVQNLLNQQFLVYFSNNKHIFIEKVTRHIKDVANHLMKGKSLDEIIDWLKRIVASTPYPPPFTFPV